MVMNEKKRGKSMILLCAESDALKFEFVLLCW